MKKLRQSDLDRVIGLVSVLPTYVADNDCTFSLHAGLDS